MTRPAHLVATLALVCAKVELAASAPEAVTLGDLNASRRQQRVPTTMASQEQLAVIPVFGPVSKSNRSWGQHGKCWSVLHPIDRRQYRPGQTLERLGLADERQAGVWQLDRKLEPKWLRLGERVDTFTMMQRALKAAVMLASEY